MTDNRRRLQGRIGAYTIHARGLTNTGPARAAFLARFEREVDPNGLLSSIERSRRAEAARRAYMTRLALKSATARAQGRNRPG